MNPLIGIGGLGGPELLLILLVVVLLFGAKKLPELARGSGQALRIFKAETKELKESDKAQSETSEDAATTAPPEHLEADRLDQTERERRAEPGI